jgi:uncharacterized membrane protein YdjX (TVP38/TMEM64 family)
MNDRVKRIVKFVGLLLIIALLAQRLIPLVTSEGFQKWIEKLGVLGPIVVIFYTVISHVLAPVSGSPGIILGFAVFGVVQTSIYLYIASLISSVINFGIARKYGRTWVEKLVGKKAMNDVDDFVTNSGRRVLAFSRLFGFILFELISYGAGLTKMKFKDYFLITVIFGAIPNALILVIFKNATFEQPEDILKWIGGLVLVGIVFGLIMKKWFLGKKKKIRELDDKIAS